MSVTVPLKTSAITFVSNSPTIPQLRAPRISTNRTIGSNRLNISIVSSFGDSADSYEIYYPPRPPRLPLIWPVSRDRRGQEAHPARCRPRPRQALRRQPQPRRSHLSKLVDARLIAADLR